MISKTLKLSVFLFGLGLVSNAQTLDSQTTPQTTTTTTTAGVVESTPVQQAASVTGTILDQNGKPLPNAVVFVNKRNLTVNTDNKGDFTIEIPANDVRYYNYLFVTAPGYVSYQLPIAKTDLPFDKDIKLVPEGAGANYGVVLGSSPAPINK